MFVILFPLAAFVIGAGLIFFNRTRLTGKIFFSLGLFFLFFIIALYSGVIVSLSLDIGYILGYFVNAGILFIPLTVILWVFNVIRKKKVWIPLVSVFGVIVISAFTIWGYNAYVDSIPVMVDRGELLWDYRPFDSQSKVAKLTKDPSLEIQSDHPTLDGATALYPIYSAFANAVYTQDGAEDILCSGTTDAYKSVTDGTCDIIFAAAPSEEQLEYAEEKGVELELTPLGYEAFVFFVNSENPIDDLKVSDIRDIYSGRVTKWRELGVYGLGSIKAFQRNEGSGSQSALIRFMEGDTLIKAPTDTVNDMGEIITRTADYRNFKNAIGFSFRFYSTEMVQNNQIKLLSLNGIKPNRENIENGSYPITDCFYMVTRKGDVTENTKKLMDFALSPEGQELINKTGYTPINH